MLSNVLLKMSIMFQTLKMTSMTQLTGSKNVVIRALNVDTMEKQTLHARIEELPFFKKVFITGELFKMDENSTIYTNNCKPITNT